MQKGCGYKVDQDSYRILCDEIKESMEIWQEECKAYNNF